MDIQPTMKALADPTRRAIMDLLQSGYLSTSEIAKNFKMSMPAVSKHLTILKKANLIEANHKGKNTFYKLNASELDGVLQWLKQLRDI